MRPLSQVIQNRTIGSLLPNLWWWHNASDDLQYLWLDNLWTWDRKSPRVLPPTPPCHLNVNSTGFQPVHQHETPCLRKVLLGMREKKQLKVEKLSWSVMILIKRRKSKKGTFTELRAQQGWLLNVLDLKLMLPETILYISLSNHRSPTVMKNISILNCPS